MREIKFRAWDEESGTMLYQGEFEIAQDADNGFCVYRYHQNSDFIELTPLEYTGLKDKNGKEIYEGDIIAYRAAWGGFNGGLIFQDGCFGVKDGIGVYTFQDLNNETIEIIGNIHENPELLEGKNQ